MKYPPPHLDYENQLWQAGFKYVAGLDEAGRGALAGPVAAGAVILPLDENIQKFLCGVRDSKLMTALQRERWAEKIKLTAVAWSVGLASNEEIDRMGIVRATHLAMQRALNQLSQPPQYLLIDALYLPENHLPQSAIIKGDRLSLSIAAASVLAKTTRDELMRRFADVCPGYGFERHKGYGTQYHLATLKKMGATPMHRFSFAPLYNLVVNPEIVI